MQPKLTKDNQHNLLLKNTEIQQELISHTATAAPNRQLQTPSVSHQGSAQCRISSCRVATASRVTVVTAVLVIRGHWGCYRTWFINTRVIRLSRPSLARSWWSHWCVAKRHCEVYQDPARWKWREHKNSNLPNQDRDGCQELMLWNPVTHLG